MNTDPDASRPPDPGARMMAVVTRGTGGYDMLDYAEVPVPRPGPGEVLIRVLAAGVNNTDINTRLGWYASSVTGGTDETGDAASPETGGGWSGETPFPLIQGTDCCGRVVAAGDAAGQSAIGARVLVRSCMRPEGFASPRTVWLGSDFDGAFAQYVTVPASEAFAIDCGWSDAELATIPCAYGTAENMIHRAGVSDGCRVLVAGASGGVGSAAVQLARRRGAHVIGITSASKRDMVRDIGAHEVIDRDADPVGALGAETVDVVIDNVAGPHFGAMLQVLGRRGRYVSSGAIAGPVVAMDMRDFYLKDLTLIGCTGWDEPVFGNLIGYIERGEIRPLLDRTYPLGEIAEAQRAFRKKAHVGKLVLIPPQ